MSKRLVFDVSEDLHRRLKVYCAGKGTTIKGELTKLIEALLESEGLVEELNNTNESSVEVEKENKYIPLRSRQHSRAIDELLNNLRRSRKQRTSSV